MKYISIFASGSGTNAENIMNYAEHNDTFSVNLLLSNKKDAYALKRAENKGIPTYVFGRKEFYDTYRVVHLLQERRTNLIVLAGFLWLVPEHLVEAFPNRIVNLHPALLPKYGGKGMYGMKVHETVLQNRDKETGITIHYVNNQYDQGEVIFQARCPVEKNDNPESLADKVHQLEYKYYPLIIEKLLETV